MFASYFSIMHQWLLAAAIAGVVVACWLWWKERAAWALALLTLSALLLKVFAATLDPFLNPWDECFHALVAKRMIEAPFTPMLYGAGILPTTPYWTHADVWLHKPPFFLWQIALSLKVFGTEPWAVRIPSALWMTALVPVTYRMGVLLADRRAGWIAALFTAMAFYPIELTAGAISTDHNDAIFIATVACSWWAVLEYWNGGGRGWPVLAGLFAACAILTKLYVGLSVFLPWGLVVLGDRKGRAEWRAFGSALLVTVALVLPWLWSTAVRFPEEFAHQWSFKGRHLAEPMEAHSGGWTFHFEVIDRLIPPFSWWIVLLALVWGVRSMHRLEHRVLVTALVVSIHLLFGFARTKMDSYTLVLFPLYMVALAHGLVRVVDVFIVERYRRPLLLLSGTGIAYFMLNLYPLQAKHTVASPPRPHQQWRMQQIEAMAVMKRLEGRIADPVRSVVFHVPRVHNIQFMFATGIEATDMMPEASDVARLRSLGYTVYAVQDGSDPGSFPPGAVLITDDELKFPDIGRP